MSEILTKSRARNIFYGGSLFFVVVFIVLTINSHRYVVNVSTAGMPLTESVILGKQVWERHSCINCDKPHGEGAGFVATFLTGLRGQSIGHPYAAKSANC